MLKLNLRKLWTFALMFYIICGTAFNYGPLKKLNTIALYFFLLISAVNILSVRKVRLTGYVVTILIMLLVVLLGALYTPLPDKYLTDTLYDCFTLAVIVVCVCQYIREIEDIEAMSFALMIAGLFFAIYIYAQYGSEFWELLRENEGHTRTINRMDGNFANANTVGMYTAVSVLIGLYNLLFNRKSAVRTMLCLGTVVFCFVVSMASGSKKSVLIILVGLVSAYLYYAAGTKFSMKQIRNLALLVVAVAAVIWMIMELPIFSGIAKRLETWIASITGGSGNYSDETRMNMITQGLKVWTEYPWIGAGTAASRFYFGHYSHSNYVEILMNHGLFGFLTFYGIYFTTGYSYIKNAKILKKVHPIVILTFALLCVMLVCGVALVYYYDRYFMILFAMIYSTNKILLFTPLSLTEQ